MSAELSPSDPITARLQQVVARLRAAGHRITPQRLAVLRALLAGADHPSVDDLYRRLRDAYPTMSLATVYKTIDALKANGEILELQFRDRANRYDAAIPAAHPHLICTKCGQLLDLDGAADLDRMAQEIAARTGYTSLRHRLDFYGLCPACRAADAPPG